MNNDDFLEPDYDIPPPRRERKEVNHKTDVGRLVYENFPNASPLCYAYANNLLSEMLIKGYTFHAFESKVVSMLRLAREKGKPNVYVIGALNKMIKGCV